MSYTRPLTRAQLDVLDYLRTYIAQNRIAPTLQQIADHLKRSKVTIFEHIEQLDEKGYIRRDHRAKRSITIIDPKENTLIRETMTLLRNLHDRGVHAGDQRVARILTRWREIGAVNA